MENEIANESDDEKRPELVEERPQEEITRLVQRLNRIEGQIRGVKRMIENNETTENVLIQVSAASSAFNSFSSFLVVNYFKSNLIKEIREGREETLEEFSVLLQRILK